MRSVFFARYYKGTNRVNEPVELAIATDGLYIKTADHSQIFWEINNVKAHPENDEHKVYLSHPKDAPVDHLEIIGQNFLSELEFAFPHVSFRRTKRNTNAQTGIILVTVVLLIIALMIATYMFLVPVLVDQSARSIPYSTEQKLGDIIFSKMEQDANLDSTKSKIINEFFDSLNWDDKFPSKVFYSNSMVVNAFALPGGNIIVYKGLLDKMQHYSELAALLGHEYGHVENRHILRGMIQSLSAYLILSFLIGDVTGIIGALAEQSNAIYNLKYTRAYESESDAFSFYKLKTSQINPQGILNLFHRLQEGADTTMSSIPDFLSTHPGVDQRIHVMTKQIESDPYPAVEHQVLDSLFVRLKRE